MLDVSRAAVCVCVFIAPPVDKAVMLYGNKTLVWQSAGPALPLCLKLETRRILVSGGGRGNPNGESGYTCGCLVVGQENHI